ncbi:hypothetical protein [Nakamurella lactea]|uniref:hypothetical protein n=1 Tax=Nakamurella lactea TaxID=459515 RepID=UPI000423A6C9|nr:hypothetical protein [Nakamurella lactea]
MTEPRPDSEEPQDGHAQYLPQADWDAVNATADALDNPEVDTDQDDPDAPEVDVEVIPDGG